MNAIAQRLALLSVVLLLVACGEPKVLPYAKLPYDGVLLGDPETGKPFNGVAKDYHKNGQLSMEIPVKNGLFHGIVREWYPDGKKKAETEFKKGERCGKNTEWTEAGLLYMERVYDRDHIVTEKAHASGK